jgi:hypothetical protein
MNTPIKSTQPIKSRDDWGFFVPIDLETPGINKKKTKHSSLIIISENEKLKYYLKLHEPHNPRSVIILKNSLEPSSPVSFKNNYLKKTNITSNHSKKSRSGMYLLLTTIFGSGLFLFFYNPSIFKLRTY